MKILRYAYFGYLVIAIAFLIDAIEKMDTKSPWLSLLFAAVATFMFFFLRKFTKKFEDRYNQSGQNGQKKI